MKLQEQKLELAKMVLNTDSEALLKQVKAVFDKAESDFWDELSDYQKKTVEEAIKQADKGEMISHKEAMKKYRKWL
jgi:predicted transcriptional regulator